MDAVVAWEDWGGRGGPRAPSQGCASLLLPAWISSPLPVTRPGAAAPHSHSKLFLGLFCSMQLKNLFLTSS